MASRHQVFLFFALSCFISVGATRVSFAKLAEPKLCLEQSCEVGPGCKEVYFIRHAEGEHQVANDEAKKNREETKAAIEEQNRELTNRRLENWPVFWDNPDAEKLTDAVLTEKGRKQCIEKQSDAPAVDLVVVSPLRRTLETAFLLFQSLLLKPGHAPFIVHDLARERYGEMTCDKRNKMSANKVWKPSGGPAAENEDAPWKTWNWTIQESSPPRSQRPGDMQYADEDKAWSPERESVDHAKKRAKIFQTWLLSHDEKRISVVTHSSYMRNMFGTDSVPKNAEPMRTVLCPK